MTRKLKLLIWTVGLLYALCAGLVFQFVFLPHLAPSLHEGNGLMAGGDWLIYDREAQELRDSIQTSGWSAWTLWYRGHSMSGLLGALYTAIAPGPWVFLPISAALHATSFLAMCFILSRFARSRKAFLIGALPMLVFPTALLWIAQPLKDGFSVCGFLLFLYSWFVAYDAIRSKRLPITKWLLFPALLVGGLALIWLARPYVFALLLVLAAVAAVTISLRLLYEHWRGWIPWRAGEAIVLMLILSLLAVSFLPIRGAERAWITLEESLAIEDQASRRDFFRFREDWVPTTWLPSAVDHFFLILSEQRAASGRSSQGAGSTVDGDLLFHSAGQLLAYMPRALQIALFAPFPTQWFAPATSAAGTTMRRISMFEVIFAYVMVPFCIGLIWIRRRSPELWLVVLLCGICLVLQPLFVANTGTIVRLRYPYFMVLVCLGFGAMLQYGPVLARRIRELVIR